MSFGMIKTKGGAAVADPNATEKAAAQLLSKMETFLDEKGDFKKTIQRIELLERSSEEFKGLNVKRTVEEFDKLKANFEMYQSAVANSKSGMWFPGIESAGGKKFSLAKAILGVRIGFEKAGAMYEKEVMDEAREKAAHIVGDDASVGFLVPDQVIADVIAAIYTRSVFINLQGTDGQTLISVMDGLFGGQVRVPKFEGGLIAYWIGEEDEYAESLTKAGDMTMTPHKLGVLVRMTDTLKRLQGFGFETMLRNDMIRAAAKKLDWTIAYGTGSEHMPRGIVNAKGIKIYRAETGATITHDDIAGVTDFDGGEVDFSGLDAMNLALEEDDIDKDPTATWVSSPRYFTRLKNRRVDQYAGQPVPSQAYLLGIPMLTDARLKDIIGPFGKTTQIKSNNLPGASIGGTTDSVTAKYTDIFGGNLGEIVLGRWGAVEIEDDGGQGKGFTSDHTYTKLRLYADIGYRQKRAIIVCADARAKD